MNYFIEGLQGSGKSTLVRRLAEKKAGYAVVREGDYSPVELAWCAYVDEDKYKVYYRDNDRTRRCKSSHQAMRNLVQFCSHLPFYCSLPEASKLFLEAYGVTASEGNALLATIRNRILKIIEERNKM